MKIRSVIIMLTLVWLLLFSLCRRAFAFPPVVTVPGMVLVYEDSLNNLISGVFIDDADMANQQVTVTASSGTVTLSNTAGLVFSLGDGVEDAAMIFSGTLANVQSAVDDMTYTPTADYAGLVSITVNSFDGSSSDTKNISVVVANAPEVSAINRAGSSPTGDNPVYFDIILSDSVTGVDTSDFAVNVISGTCTGSVAGVSGSGSNYSVSVNQNNSAISCGLQLTLIDNDSIVNGSSVPLGGVGTGVRGDGSFYSGQIYELTLSPPHPSQPDLVSASDSNIPTDNRTNITTATFCGSAQTDSTVELWYSGVVPTTALGSSTATGGNWCISVSASNPLPEGSGVVWAKATNTWGTSSPSPVLAIQIDTTPPSVEITQTSRDPTAESSTILFNATFSKPVYDFTNADVAVSGTAGAFAAVGIGTSGDTSYPIQVTGISGYGTVNVTIIPGVAYDAFGNFNQASINTDNVATYAPPGFNVSPVSVSVSEPAGSTNFSLKLNTYPGADVFISAVSASNGECSVSPNSTTIAATAWNVGTTFTVQALDDNVIDGAQTCLITIGTASSSDFSYEGLDPDDVTVTVLDNDTPPATLYTLQITGSGQGTVFSPSGIDCHINDALTNGTCATTLAQGTSIQLTPTSVSGMVFSNWSGDCAGQPANASITLGQNALCQANFTADVDQDGVPDRLQPNIATLNGITVIAYDCPNCSVQNLTLTDPATHPIPDPTYRFMAPLMAYEITGVSPGGTIKVGVRYPMNQTPTNWQYRIFGPLTPGNASTETWFTHPNASFITFSLLGQAIVESRLLFTDGQLGDATIADGIIKDPGGPAIGRGVVGFEAPSYTFSEDSLKATLSVNRVGGSYGIVTASYTTQNDSALAGSDYVASSGILTWPDGDITPQVIAVPLLQDTQIEGNERLQVALSGADVDNLRASAEIRIIDRQPQIELTPLHAYGHEGTTLTFTLQRMGNGVDPLTVAYTTQDDSAQAGLDYQAVHDTLSWANGELSAKTISLAAGTVKRWLQFMQMWSRRQPCLRPFLPYCPPAPPPAKQLLTKAQRQQVWLVLIQVVRLKPSPPY